MADSELAPLTPALSPQWGARGKDQWGNDTYSGTGTSKPLRVTETRQ
jgi:hypothetical protein